MAKVGDKVTSVAAPAGEAARFHTYVTAIDKAQKDLGKNPTPSQIIVFQKMVERMVGFLRVTDLDHAGATKPDIERCLNSIKNVKNLTDKKTQGHIDYTVACLELALPNAPMQSTVHSNVAAVPSSQKSETLAVLKAPDAPIERKTTSRTVVMVEDDELLARHVCQQLKAYGFDPKWLPSTSGLEKLLHETDVAALIMDLVLNEGEDAGARILESLRSKGIELPPIVFVSARTDFEARLMAVRAGARAYMEKSFDFQELFDHLDRICATDDHDPYRVVMVDDDADILKMNAWALQKTGMNVQTTTNPARLMGILDEFQPDVMITDLQMPGCDGIELATVVRQNIRYVGLPIIFVSGVTDANLQFKALELGGDAFLTKPIKPEMLAATVRSRAFRARRVRGLMYQDSLTGLLNHSAAKELLERELVRSKRLGEPISFAMVDIDHFKKVNDTYGHPVGDRVLKSFSRMLTKRLRKTDGLGRYGGEEFCLIMPNTPAENAKKIIDDMRERFAKVNHDGNGTPFTVTFSGGIACAPPSVNEVEIVRHADEALYQAKRAGRNQVIVSDIS